MFTELSQTVYVDEIVEICQEISMISSILKANQPVLYQYCKEKIEVNILNLIQQPLTLSKSGYYFC